MITHGEGEFCSIPLIQVSLTKTKIITRQPTKHLYTVIWGFFCMQMYTSIWIYLWSILSELLYIFNFELIYN